MKIVPLLFVLERDLKSRVILLVVFCLLNATKIVLYFVFILFYCFSKERATFQGDRSFLY